MPKCARSQGRLVLSLYLKLSSNENVIFFLLSALDELRFTIEIWQRQFLIHANGSHAFSAILQWINNVYQMIRTRDWRQHHHWVELVGIWFCLSSWTHKQMRINFANFFLLSLPTNGGEHLCSCARFQHIRFAHTVVARLLLHWRMVGNRMRQWIKIQNDDRTNRT